MARFLTAKAARFIAALTLRELRADDLSLLQEMDAGRRNDLVCIKPRGDDVTGTGKIPQCHFTEGDSIGALIDHPYVTLLPRFRGENGGDWNGDLKPGPLEIGFDTCFLLPTTNDRVPQVYVHDHRVPESRSFGSALGDSP